MKRGDGSTSSGSERRDGGDRTRYRWIVLAVSVGTQGIANCYLLGLAAVAPEIKVEFNLTLFQVGLVLAAPIVGLATTTLLWGIACDRYDEYRLLASGLCGAALALLWAAASKSLGPLVLALFVAGASGAVANTATSRSIVAWFPIHERGMALGVRHMSAPAGVLMAGLFFPRLVRAGLSAVFVALALLVLLAAAISFLLLRRPLSFTQIRAAESGSTSEALRDGRLWRLSSAASLTMVCQAVLLSYMTLFLTISHSISLSDAGLVLALTYGLAALGRIGVGWLSDKRKHRLPLLRMLALGSGLFTISIGTFEGMSLVVVLPLLVIASLFSSVPNGLNFAAAAEIAGLGRVGTSIGLLNTATTAAGALGTCSFGFIVSWWGWRWAFVVVGMASLGGWLALGTLQDEELSWT